MSTSENLRVLLVGYGLGGRTFHAPFVDAVDGLELAAVVTGNPQRQEQVRAEHPGVAVHPGVEEALRAEAGGLDLVCVASPNDQHVPIALQALDAGLHVVVDKPLAVDADAAQQLADRAGQAGRLLVPYQNRRWDADLLTLRRLLAAGELGDVYRFESRFDRWRPQLKGGWREQAPAGTGGGLLLDLGAHLVDQATLLFGPPTEVYAELDARRAGIAAEDDVFVALTHAGGVRSHLWASAVSADLAPRFRALGSKAAFVAHGLDPQEDALRAGTLPTDAGYGEVAESAWPSVVAGDERRAVRSERGDYRAFWSALVRAVREGAAPPVDVADAVRTLRIIDAARVSAAQGTAVRLDA